MKLPNRIRKFNKHFTNPLLGRFAHSTIGPVAIIRHVGRRSGKPYQTPVFAFPTADGFLVALTYGREVDWYRNVMAAGRCTLIWHRQEYVMKRIVPLELAEARPLLPQPFRATFRLVESMPFARMYAS
jgi:deazaflavin-dependent oxidoreductase (nitroreductase family)